MYTYSFHNMKSPVLVLVIDKNRRIYKGFIPDIAAVSLLVKGIFAALRVVLVYIVKCLIQGLIALT